MDTLIWTRGWRGMLANAALVAGIGLLLFLFLTLGMYPLVSWIAG